METPRGDGMELKCDRGPIPIDLSKLAEISGGDRSVEIRMLRALRASNKEDAAALRRAIAREDIAEVARVSHRLVGAGRIAGAAVLTDICYAIEQVALTGDWYGVMALCDACYDELARIHAYLCTLDLLRSPTS